MKARMLRKRYVRARCQAAAHGANCSLARELLASREFPRGRERQEERKIIEKELKELTI